MTDAQVTTQGHGAGTARLKAWAVNPTEGGKLFRWGQPGAFERALAFYRDKVPAHMLHGWVANLYFLATGRHPGGGRGTTSAAR